MREPKPAWKDVPEELRARIAAAMGSAPVRGHRVFGGYGPRATFRIRLEDGRTLFATDAGPGSNEVNWRVLPNEEEAYRRLVSIRPVAPAYYGSVAVDGWHLLLLEDLSRPGKSRSGRRSSRLVRCVTSPPFTSAAWPSGST